VRESLDRQRGPGILRSLASLIRDAEKGNCRPLRSRIEVGSGGCRQDNTERQLRAARREAAESSVSERVLHQEEYSARKRKGDAAEKDLCGPGHERVTFTAPKCAIRSNHLRAARFGGPRKPRLSASLAVVPSGFWHVASWFAAIGAPVTSTLHDDHSGFFGSPATT
jgi:hypothetical protein